MANRRRLNLSLSMASPVQREAWEVISAIPPGQRTEAVCKMILEANNLHRLLDMVRAVLREELQGLDTTTTIRTQSESEAGDVDKDVLGFLLSLQEGDDDARLD